MLLSLRKTGLTSLFKEVSRERRKHININKFAGLSQDWVGAKFFLMCFFFRVIPYGGEKTPPKSRDNPVNILFTCFFVYVFFRSLFNRSGRKRAFSFPGATWGRFRCTVEPSPGLSRCRTIVHMLERGLRASDPNQ